MAENINKNKYKMTAKKLIGLLSKVPEDTQIFVASDEELNIIYKGVDVTDIKQKYGKKALVLYGLTGSELEENNI
ncbi:MAG: hypothetical protein QXL51_06950 [Candidatus Aenigmatarchaeota archaeon]